MGGNSPEEIHKETRTYIMVFAALAVLTIVTVAISYLNLSAVPAVFLAMVVAGVKASLVAAYFMHLISERRVIYAILALTVVFFAALFVLPYGWASDGTGQSTEQLRPAADATEH